MAEVRAVRWMVGVSWPRSGPRWRSDSAGQGWNGRGPEVGAAHGQGSPQCGSRATTISASVAEVPGAAVGQLKTCLKPLPSEHGK